MAEVIVLSKAHIEALTDVAVTGGSINVDGELILSRQGATSVNAGVVGRAAGLAADITIPAGDTEGYLDYTTIQEESLNQDSTNWVDRVRKLFKPFTTPARTVQWDNEYGEKRLAPAKHNTTALVIYVRENPTVQTSARNDTVPVMVVRNDRDTRVHYWGIYDNGVVKFGPNAHVDVPQIVLGAADPVPAGLPAGTIIHRTA